MGSTRFTVANLRSESRNPRVVGRPQGARRRLQLAEPMPGMCAWCRQSCLVWLQTREPQSASCGPVASRSSQIAARSIEARHVLRHDCSSQSTARSSQTVAQAVPFLRSQRAPRSSQGADFCAGGPRLTLFSSRRIADRTVADRSTLVRRSRLTLFSSRRIADRTVAQSQIAALWPGGQGRGQLWFALSQFAGRKVQEFEQEGLSSRGQIACLQGAGCMKCPRSGVVSGGLHI